jgi:TRAP-type C4-dicarboxylate transport system permease small subunit
MHVGPVGNETSGCTVTNFNPRGGAGMTDGYGGLRRLIAMIGRFDRHMAAVERHLLGIGIMLMALITIANVMDRIVFSSSLFFAEEVSQFLVVLVTFVGTSTAARMGRHIRMTAFVDALGVTPRKVLLFVISLTTACLLFLLAWYSLDYLDSLARVGRLTPSLRIPVYVIYAFLPVGLVLAGIQYLLAAVANVVREGAWVSFSQEDIGEAEEEAALEGHL